MHFVGIRQRGLPRLRGQAWKDRRAELFAEFGALSAEEKRDVEDTARRAREVRVQDNQAAATKRARDRAAELAFAAKSNPWNMQSDDSALSDCVFNAFLRKLTPSDATAMPGTEFFSAWGPFSTLVPH